MSITKQENIDQNYPPADKEILSLNEAAALLGIHPNTLALLLKEGAIRCQRIGRSLRFRRSWIIEYMESAPPTATEAWAASQG